MPERQTREPQLTKEYDPVLEARWDRLYDQTKISEPAVEHNHEPTKPVDETQATEIGSAVIVHTVQIRNGQQELF